MKLNKKHFLSILLFAVLLFGSLSSGSVARTGIQLDGISVVINEIHYNPGSVQGNDNDYEFAELHNNGSSAVDLTGWTFEAVSLDGVTIAAGGYVIIAYTGATYSGLASATCSVVDVGGYFGLSNGGNTLDLMDGASPVDSVTYDDFDPWPTSPDGGGPSLERIDPKFGSNNVTNWGAASEVGGSPCAQSTIHFSVDTYPEIVSHSHRSWTPTAGSDVTFKVKATDNKGVSSVTVDVSSDNFVTNTTLNLLDGDSDDVYEAIFVAGATGTDYTYSVTVEDNAAQQVSEWNNFMNFTVADVYPFISGFSPEYSSTDSNVADLEYMTISFDGRGIASSYDLAGHEIAEGNGYLGNMGWYDSLWEFPAGSVIADGETIFIAKNGTTFEAYYKFAADFEFNGTAESSAIDMVGLEIGGSYSGFDLHDGAQELSIINSGSVLDAVQYADWSSPNFRGDTGMSAADLWSANSQYGLASRDSDDPLNDFEVIYQPYVRPNNVLNNSQVAPNAQIDFDIFDKDNMSRVYFSWDGAANTTESAPYTTNVPSSLGSHTLTVFANESGGFYTLIKYVYVASDAPVFTLISPADNAIIPAAATVSVSIVDSDGVGSVDYNWNGAANASMSIEVDNTYDITGPSTDGAHTLNVFAADVNAAGSSAVYTFTVDGTDPVLALTSPTNNTSVDVGTVVKITVTDDNLAVVSVSVNDAADVAIAAPYEYALSVAGAIQLKITAEDDAGNTASILLKYTVTAVVVTTPTTPVTTVDTSEEAGFLPGFTMVYALIAFVSVVQLVKFNKSRR